MYLSDFANCFLDFQATLRIIPAMNTPLAIFLSTTLVGITVAYTIVYIFIFLKIRKSEQQIVEIFLQKIAKIPAVIEVMRPYVVDAKQAFGLMTYLHSDSMIHEYGTIHTLLEQNARINDQYGFLMRLSMAIPQLQKDIYFIYIRDFVMSYDYMMRSELPVFNALVKKWNIFVRIKNYTGVGYLFPGQEKVEI